MAKKRNALASTCSLFLITTVALLIPGAGLATLPIPDNEPDATVLALADYSHLGKRNIDDSSRSPLGLVSLESRQAETTTVSSGILLPRPLQIRSVFLSDLDIRAPPLSASLLIINSFSNTYV